MRIKKILNQHRWDVRVDYECEHCGYIEAYISDYDDAYFHENVIPKMECPKCGKTADENYRPLATRYPEGYQI